MADKIDIKIDAKVFYQMFEFSTYAKSLFGTEIAGWGHYTKDKGIYKLAPLPKQIISGAEVDTFPDEILRDTEYDISDMTVQWHSHVDFAPNPSGTDEALIRKAMELFPYLISIIVNCKNEYTAMLNIKKSGEIYLPTPIRLDVNLVPYYDNSEVKTLVKKQCKQPKAVPIIASTHWSSNYAASFKTISTKEVPSTDVPVKKRKSTLGWNPHYGMGLYMDDDFYPDNANYFVKDVVWNPLKNHFDRDDRKGEVCMPIGTKNISEDDLELFPVAEEAPIVDTDDEYDTLTEYDITQIEKRVHRLERNNPNSFAVAKSGDIMWVQHTLMHTYLEIDAKDMVIYVDGDIGTWNDFLQAVGCLEPQYWYQPGDCVACNAVGKSSKGKKCFACNGTGKLKEKTQ